jgi:hypothetical protein
MAQTNRLQRMSLCVMPAIFAVYLPMCTPRVTPAQRPWEVPMAQLWEKPVDLAARDLYHGPWGAERAPAPDAVYSFVARKQHGTNPGMTVADPAGREWSVKQAPHNDQGAEGPVEVVLSRILSAVGYHQPPVYFLPSFTITDATGTHTEPGGRFRLKTGMLAKRGDWSWQQNPFVGTRPYQGLLVILTLFDSSDLKNVNNALYELKAPGEPPQVWYVVRDLGTALGETGRLTPKRNDPDLFEQKRFINGVRDGYVEFHYHGWHQELLRQRITPDEVYWASDLLAGLSYGQWQDAFRAGGYAPDEAARFIRRILAKVAEGERLERVPARPLLRAASSSPRSK